VLTMLAQRRTLSVSFEVKCFDRVAHVDVARDFERAPVNILCVILTDSFYCTISRDVLHMDRMS
jgi:hypothetical protein